ncbi:unnamed protein product [Alopecurus aequalis]
MDHRKQQQRSAGSAASSGKHGGGKGSGKAGGGSGGGKKPIKVVYISNPMRVKTSAAGFRALVQELTGRNADPSKYSADDDAAAAQQELSPEGSAAMAAPDAAAPGPAAAPDFAAAAFGDGDDEVEDDIFRTLDNDYSVFSPPTLFYDYPHGRNKV